MQFFPTVRRRGRLALPAVLLVASSSCRVGGGGSGSGDAGSTSTSPECTRDPNLLSQRQACSLDDQCPCGMHCELGLCAAECGTPALGNCYRGESCDRFGRCRPTAEVNNPAPSNAAPQGTVHFAAGTTLLRSTQDTRQLSLTFRDADQAQVRVAATEPFQVRCSDTGDYASECLLGAVGAGNVVNVSVRLAPNTSPLPTGPGEVRVWWGNQSTSTSVSLAAQTTDFAGVAGIYEGTASPVSIQATANGTPNAAATSLPTGVPVRVQLFLSGPSSTQGTLVLEDPTSLLTGEATTVIPLTQLNSSMNLLNFQLEGHTFLRSTIASGLDFAADLRIPLTSTTILRDAQNNPGFTLTFNTEYFGLGTPGSNWFQAATRWALSLRRTGDLPQGAIAPPNSPVITDPSRVMTDLSNASSDWDRALARSFRPFDGIPIDAGDAVLATVYNAPGTPLRSLEACSASPESDSVRVALLYRQLWSARPYMETESVTRLGSLDQRGDEITRSVLSRLFAGLSAVYPNANLPRLNNWTFNGTLDNSSASNVPCAVTVSRSTYQSAFCNLNPALSDDLQLDRCSLLESFGFASNLSNIPAGSPSATTGRVVLNGSWNFEYGDATPRAACSSRNANTNGRLAPASTTRVFNANDIPVATASRNCAAVALCAGGTVNGQSMGLRGSTLNNEPDTLLPTGGDLQCAMGGRSAALEMDQQRDTQGGAQSISRTVSRCLADLSRLTAAPPTITTSQGDAALPMLFQSNGCIDAVRHSSALTFALREARSTAASRRDPAVRMAHRLLQQWLQVHTLIASEGFQRAAVTSQLRGPDEVMLPEPPALLTAAVRGLHALLHPRVEAVFQRTNAQLLVNPDYRADAISGFQDDSVDHAQGTLLVVQQAHLLRAILNLADSVLERSIRTQDSSARETVGFALRSVWLAHIQGEGLATRVRALAPNAPWTTAYDQARAGYLGRLNTLLSRYRRLFRGGNPLGIEDGEVPLYFSGSPSNAAERFTPVSDYLLGIGASASAWAPSVVASAQATASELTAAYQARAQATYQQALSAADLERQLNEIRGTYGMRITGLCGSPPGVTPNRILEDWENASGAPFSGDSCYRRSEDPVACPPAPRDPVAAGAVAPVTRADVAYRLCRSAQATRFRWEEPNDAYSMQIRRRWLAHPDNLVFASAELNQLRRVHPDHLAMMITHNQAVSPTDRSLGCTEVYPCDDNPLRRCITCRGVIHNDSVYTGSNVSTRGDTPGQWTSDGYTENEMFIQRRTITAVVSWDILNSTRVAPGISGADYDATEAACRTLFPTANEVAPAAPVPSPTLDNGNCYSGALGSDMLNIRGLAIDIATARDDMGQFIEDYNRALQSCEIRFETALNIASRRRTRDARINELRRGKQAADTIAAIAGSAKDCAMAATDGASGALLSLGTSAAGATVACAAAAIEGIANIASVNLSADIDREEDRFQADIANLQSAGDYRACLNDAGQYLSGLRAATQRLLRARQDFLSATYDLGQDTGAAQDAWDDGQAALASLRQRHVAPPDSTGNLPVTVQRFQDQMRLARRVVMLATRAVEYELQASLSASDAILRAETPAELQTVIDQLRLAAATRRIRGNLPLDQLAVLSLRQHLLQLYSQEASPSGWQTLTAADRFRLVLNNPRFRGSDSTIRIPFAINPVGALGSGTSQGISLLAGSDCAERLWSVNAALVGTNVLTSSDSTFARIELVKANTYYSQWCAPNNTGSNTQGFQNASFRPAVNLFQDPDAPPQAGTPMGGMLASNAQENSETRARIRAYLNVSRAQLEQDAYATGASAELAGRGLYGSYALVIPASSISRCTGSTCTSGINLNNIDDILLRLQYVSVARPSN